MRSKASVPLLLAFCLAVAAWSPLPAAEPGSILFILDASGSMNGRIDGREKILIAKEALASLVADLPRGTRTGLLVYGHGGAGSGCENIELVVPLQAAGGAAIRERLGAVRAKGKTPIAGSLRMAADALRQAPGHKAIVLVSDGEETCGGDPVGQVREIRERLGIDVVVHVIGFDVRGREQEQLARIAGAGGGRYHSAKDARQLRERLVAVRREIEAQAIAQRKALRAGAAVFTDGFDGDALAEGWQVINEDEDGMALDEGFLVLVHQPGSFAAQPKADRPNVRNLLVYGGDLPRDYEVVTAFRTELTDWPLNRKGEQWSGLVLYRDARNLLGLVVGTYYGDKGYSIGAWFFKLQKGKLTLQGPVNLF